MRPSFLTITIMSVKLDRWLREYNDHNPNCASNNNNNDKKRLAVLTCIISRSATRQACFAKGKVHFQPADTDRQLVSDPRQRAAVSPLNFSGSRLLKKESLEFRGRSKLKRRAEGRSSKTIDRHTLRLAKRSPGHGRTMRKPECLFMITTQ